MPFSEEDIQKSLSASKERMSKSVGAFKKDIANIRSMRASPSMLDLIQVEYYGAMVPVNQLASISIPEPRMIVLTPFDKNAIQNISKAILKSDLGLTPQNDGSIIRLVLPELSLERRQELVKQLKRKLEETRISLRNIRRDANEEAKKFKAQGASEDQIKSIQKDIQKLTDHFISESEQLAHQKEEAILNI